MSKRLLICWCLWFLQYLFISGQAVAAECSNKLNSNKDFYIDFEIPSANLNERVVVSQANSGRSTQVIWTDDEDEDETNKIVEKNFVAGGHYFVRLIYISEKNKSGTLKYFNKNSVSESWKFVSEKLINLSAINAASFSVVSRGDVTKVECAEGEPPPSPLPVIPDVCDYFPGPVQTWVGNENNYFSMNTTNRLVNDALPDDHSVGFSNVIVEKDFIGFSKNTYVQGSCNGETCQLDGVMSQKLDLFWDDSSAKIENDIVINSIETAIPNTSYKSTFGGHFAGLSIESGGKLIMPEGQYWVDNMDVRGNLTTQGSVVLHVWGRLDVAGEINTTNESDNLTILSYGWGKSCPFPSSTGEPPASLPSVYPPQVASPLAVNLNIGGSLNGRIYSQGPVALSGDVTLRGAITACQLEMSNTAQIVGNSQCFNPPDNNYQLVVSPSRALGLLCERQPVEFQVLDSNGALASQFNGEIEVSTNLTGSGQALWYEEPDGGTGTDAKQSQRFSVVNGTTQLWLKSDVIETIVVTGQLVSDGNPSAQGQYSFVPFKLQIQEQALKVVAGKPEPIRISAMSCDTSAATSSVAKDYSGTRTLQLSTRYTLPDSGGSAVELRDNNGHWQSSSVVLNFQEGSAESELRYLDAGQTQLSLVDPNCTKAGGCSISGNGSSLADLELGDWTRLEGVQTVWSRPYTFALCDVTSDNGKTDFSGTASGGPGFAAAGDKFSVTFKPVIWTQDAVMADQSGDGINDIRTTTSAWCNQLTTPNYYSVSGLVTAPIQLSIPGKPASPTGDGVVAGSLGGTLYHEFTGSEATAGWTIDDLSWSEVGSLWLQADADYLGMPVDQGIGQLGRFYPAHFVIKESAVSDAYGSFTYMNQPFSLSATIEAQNTQNQPTQNYGYFADDYQESLQLRAVNAGATGSDANNLTSRLSEQLSYQQWDKALQTITTDALALLRVLSSTNPNVTEPDGPYPVDLGLVVESRDDCATRGCSDFSNQPLNVYELDGATPETAAALAGDIHARYGRMRLEDAVGREGEKINIPVLLEYWEAGQFVTHSDDYDSVFNGQRYFRQGITNPSTSAITASVGDIKVHAGRSASGDLYATEGVSSEQVRFWQKLVADIPAVIAGENPVTDSASGTHAGSESQPWLLYNWRGQGDENPSALVTFGVYRGNDRVIYRGERNIPVTINR
ncbi:DUF6701 domain-containing protein [Photobacterium sp. TLY01]|uniref:DUF6701 domain-containing protein n=1 Tax=Photobacterium sp. TLY01 TaxID=2907534 RepID=UPI001F30DAF3|nr:DUF6701 domain-containing protein [Photobacterium sp. TLY01]UIP28267.1 polymer-forming cytoskeletal protein [Photobacterium sp. TLY01]